MDLIIGGKAQGKFEYAKEKYCLSERDIFFADKEKDYSGEKVVYGFQNLVKTWLKKGLSPLQEVNNISAEIIIADEIGNGIVPINSFEILWREECGRCLCVLAKRADRVTRVFCSIPKEIK